VHFSSRSLRITSSSCFFPPSSFVDQFSSCRLGLSCVSPPAPLFPFWFALSPASRRFFRVPPPTIFFFPGMYQTVVRRLPAMCELSSFSSTSNTFFLFLVRFFPFPLSFRPIKIGAHPLQPNRQELMLPPHYLLPPSTEAALVPLVPFSLFFSFAFFRTIARKALVISSCLSPKVFILPSQSFSSIGKSFWLLLTLSHVSIRYWGAKLTCPFGETFFWPCAYHQVRFFLSLSFLSTP